MNIVVVGGNERMKKDYISLAKEKGYNPKIFLNMSSRFSKSMGSPKAIVIFTSTVSHTMSNMAEFQAKRLNIPIVRHRYCSKKAFIECLGMIDQCNKNCNECKCIKCDIGRCIVSN